MGSFLADALWRDLELGVLARSRDAHDACAALHAAGRVDDLVARAADAFGAREDNFKEAVERAWGIVGRHDQRKEFERRAAGRRDALLQWLFDVAARDAPALANSRLFLDPPFPDRVWVERGGAWDLAWRRAGEWRLKSLKEVRASGVSPLETLLVVRVGGDERANPRLPPK